MNRLRVPKDMRPLVDAAVAAGWTLRATGRHAKLTAPDGHAVSVPGTSSAPRTVLAFRAALRRHGAPV